MTDLNIPEAVERAKDVTMLPNRHFVEEVELAEDVLALASLVERLTEALEYVDHAVHAERHILSVHGCDQGPALTDIRDRAKAALAEAQAALKGEI